MKPEAKVKLPLGHEFKTWTWGALAGANTYCYSCGQPRSAHEPK